MIQNGSIRRQIAVASVLVAFPLLGGAFASAAVLSGSFSELPRGSNVNLTAAGPLDWVHWGLYTDTSIDRKEGVPQQIGDYVVIGPTNDFLAAYQYGDNWNSYSWSDGAPTASQTNTTTGIWAYGFPENMGSGFELTAPADPTIKTLEVYVGAFDARGKFEARLSDSSAPGYTNTALVNLGNGPSGVYRITYAAQTAGQTLNIKWTLLQPIGMTPNVTLQAAALTAANANNPPIIAITNPVMNAKFTAPANLVIGTKASDLDGTVTLVEFYDGATKLGDATASPFGFTWNNAPPGYHVLTARAIDDRGASRASVPIDVFVNTSGGTLTGMLTLPSPDSVDLTAEGTSDWVHWGLTSSNSLDRKNGVSQKLSDFSLIGAHAVQRYTNNNTRYSWSDGTPTLNAFGTPTGVFIDGNANGFEILAPADTNPRQLKVYAGLYGAQGNFQAYLSDASARAYTDTSVSNIYGDIDAAYTLNYSAASANQTLIVRYRSLKLFDFDFGNVTLQAATLQGGPVDPQPVTILNPTHNGGEFILSFMTEAGRTYTVQATEFFNPAAWQSLTNFSANGSTVVITNQTAPALQKFYRVIAE